MLVVVVGTYGEVIMRTHVKHFSLVVELVDENILFIEAKIYIASYLPIDDSVD